MCKTLEVSCILHSCSPLAFYSISLEVPTVALISISAGESERTQEAAADLKIIPCAF